MVYERSNYYKTKLSEIYKKSLDNAPEDDFFEKLNEFNSELDAEIKGFEADIQKILKGVGILQ